MMVTYQRRLIDYVKANHPCYPSRKRKGMSAQQLRELDAQADAVAMGWFDSNAPMWRDAPAPPSANKIVVTISNNDEDDDDE